MEAFFLEEVSGILRRNCWVLVVHRNRFSEVLERLELAERRKLQTLICLLMKMVGYHIDCKEILYIPNKFR